MMFEKKTWKEKALKGVPEDIASAEKDISLIYTCVVNKGTGEGKGRTLDLDNLEALSSQLFSDKREGYYYIRNAADEMLDIVSNDRNHSGYHLEHEEGCDDECWIVGRNQTLYNFYGMFFSEDAAVKEARKHRKGYYKTGVSPLRKGSLRKVYYVYGASGSDEEGGLPVDELIGIYKSKERAELTARFYRGSVIAKHIFKERWTVVNNYTENKAFSDNSATELQALCHLYLGIKPEAWMKMIDFYWVEKEGEEKR